MHKETFKGIFLLNLLHKYLTSGNFLDGKIGTGIGEGRNALGALLHSELQSSEMP